MYSEQSDIDVVISYSGNIREDDFFNSLHEEGFSFAGIPVDINPISTEKTVTLEDYLESAENYLDEKEAKQKSQPEKPEKRKESVVQALRDRQAKLKAQEVEKPKQKTQTHKKGDHEL